MAFHAPCRARLVDLDGTSGVYRYGTGLGPGVGATPQISDAQGGRGGVGMRNSLPCVAAVPPVMQVPVKVLMSGYGVVNPSVSVPRKATIWFSSVIRQHEISDRHVEIVRDLRHRPAVHFFCLSRRAVSGSNFERKHVPRVVEMDELLQALGVAVMKELFLEVRYWLPVRVELAGFGGRTLWRCQGHIARRRCLHLAVGSWRKLYPLRVRIGGGAEVRF